MACKNMGFAINQNMYWCNKQMENFPICKNCLNYEEEETPITISSNETKLKGEQK